MLSTIQRVLACAGLLFALSTIHCQAVDLPVSRELPSSKIQGWTEQDRQDWYHTSVGTRLIPYDWFVALQDEQLAKVFSDSGIIPDSLRPDRLPVGLSEPQTPKPSSSHTGMNCAF